MLRGVTWECVEWEGTNALRNLTSGIRKQSLLAQGNEDLWHLFWSGLRQSSYVWGSTVEEPWRERDWEKREGKRKKEGGKEEREGWKKEGRSGVFQIDNVQREQPGGPRLRPSVHLPSPQRQMAQMRMNFREEFVEFIPVLQCSNDATSLKSREMCNP